MSTIPKNTDKTAIHIFRRDYRLYDNTSLIEVCKTHDTVIPIFIFTQKQIDPAKNPFRSDNSVQFLCESLVDLDKQIHEASNDKSKLHIFYGDEFTILESLIKTIPNLATISFNMDYTKYSIDRDSQITKLCSKHGITILSLDDICLNPYGTIKTTTGKIYSKFTPFWRASASKDIRKPISNSAKNYLSYDSKLGKILSSNTHTISIDEIMKPHGKIMGTLNSQIRVNGGRTNGLNIIKNITTWKSYDTEHDNLTYETTHLSAFNKFGCVSIREVYHAMITKLGKDNGVIRQLFWRDFFYHLSAENPIIYENALNPKYRNIKWPNNLAWFNAWKSGKTGYPVVDACMCELNTTGYMHNRGRLIVSSFLCRMLHVNWQWGEKYFAQKLVDYDPAQNNFGWQVSGANSSGTTSRPLEQTILNPWIQSVQFDRDGKYIKKWLPKLKDVSPGDLHKWDQTCDKWLSQGVKYIKPIVDYKIEKENNLKMYKKYI
jgi:deoxyribodipyrimidine photo-lyase